MKKQILYAAGIAATVLIMGSCKKQAAPETAENNPAATKMKTISSAVFRYYEYGKDITEEDFLVNKHDDKDQAFNYVNHAMTIALLDIYQNRPEIMTKIVADIDASKNKELNLYNIADRYPELNRAMDVAFKARYGIADGTWRDYVKQHYVYDTKYVPFIGFMNLGKVDAKGQAAYVSEPLELNEEKFTQFDDDYPMWIATSKGEKLKFTSVNEEKGYYLTNPIVRIANGFEGDDKEEYTKIPCRFEENGKDISMNKVPQERPTGVGGGSNPVYPGQQPTQYPQKDEWLTHVKFQINERYENWGKSEYQFVWAYGSGFNHINFTWPKYSGPIRSIEKNLEKNQIGTEIPFYFDVFQSSNYVNNASLKFRIQYMPSDKYCFYAVAAFERDWGAGRKKLFRLCESTKDTKGPRKFDDEWYFINPVNNNSYPFNIRNPNYHTSYWNYTKGVLQLHRWNL